MIQIKTREEIEIMRRGGEILAGVLFKVLKQVRPGVSGLELDRQAEKLILEKGAQPAFKKVKGYRYTLCLSVNDVIVHGLPNREKIKEGDLVGIDCGVYYQGFYTDMAWTIKIQNSPLHQDFVGQAKFKIQNGEVGKFLEVGEKALAEAIKQARVGNRIGNISKTIQEVITGAGYSVVRSLVGHGIGRQLHGEPEIPGFLTGPVSKTLKLEPGMTLAIEVIYNQGGSDVLLSEDGWTIKTQDGSLSGLFERTIAVTDNGPVVLTK